MKQVIYILILAFGLLSCNNQKEKKIDVTQITSADKIFIKDKSLYDPIFIKGLYDYNEPVKLIDNYILTGKDTTYFPEDLPLNKKVVLKGVKDNNNFILSVTRTNLTNLVYDFQLSDKNNKRVESKSGKAILGSMFFLAPENDEDSQTGISYGSSEYTDNIDDCWFSIRIGIGLDDNGKHRAKLSYNCQDKHKNALNLDECPILRAE